MKIKVLILTPLSVEYDAVSQFLTGDRTNTFQGTANYEHGNFEGKYHQYSIVIREPGMKNVDMALATEKALQYFEPHIVMLIGIAGGVKDVKIGDVLVAKKVYGYESGKEDVDGFKARPAVESFSGELLARAQAISRGTDWKRRLAHGAPEAKVFLGPIAAGDKVIAGADNPTFKRLKLHFNDTLALEMESIGFATALQEHRQVHGMVIRGISDLCEGKSETDKQNWQSVAAERAAAFGFELLSELKEVDWLSDSNPVIKSENKPNKAKIFEKDRLLIEELIASGNTEEAVKILKEFSDNNPTNFKHDILQIAERWNAYSQKVRRGTVTNADAIVERGQIVSGLIEIINLL